MSEEIVRSRLRSALDQVASAEKARLHERYDKNMPPLLLGCVLHSILAGSFVESFEK